MLWYLREKYNAFTVWVQAARIVYFLYNNILLWVVIAQNLKHQGYSQGCSNQNAGPMQKNLGLKIPLKNN